MFTAFNERNDFSYAFEKIRNAISAPGENNLYAATELGLGILLRKYEQFRQELDAAGELGNWMRPVSWETGNMISIPTITVLRCCNVTSPAIHPD